jgi:hypothetical protein
LNQRDDKIHRVIYPPCIADTPIFEVSTQDEFTAENTNKHVPLEEERVKNAMAQLNQQKETAAAAAAASAAISKSTPGGKRVKKQLGKKTLVSLMNLKVRETA